MPNRTFFLPDVNIKADEMQKAISSIASILIENGIITNQGYSVLSKVASSLKKLKNSQSWVIMIDRDMPLEFVPAEDVYKGIECVVPKISCELISVNQQNYNNLPFDSFDVSVQIDDMTNKPISRWHIDLANKKDDGRMQNGPLTHLQFGGHIPEQRSDDYPLKVPRWSHPPLDIILLCEVITANFYPKIWDKIKDTPCWCDAISVSQKLCYTVFLRRFVPQLSISNTTILNEFDASKWIS